MESPKFAIALEKEEKHDYNWWYSVSSNKFESIGVAVIRRWH